MSKHIGRKQRWTQDSTTQHSSPLGKVVYEQRAWYGILEYRTRAGDALALLVWVAQQQRLGPYKRPRNAMVALEREATALRNRHGQDILLGVQLWTEAGGESLT